MGYTHYFSCKGDLSRKGWNTALATVKDIIARHRSVLARELDRLAEEPVANEDVICFNGRGKEGCETFHVSFHKPNDFCKTERRPYDQAVCEILLVLAWHLEKFVVKSDGFYGPNEITELSEADGTWPQAAQIVENLYGLRLKVKNHVLVTA